MNKNNIKYGFYLFGTIVFVYVLLFEFMLPINKILPKPSILIESFVHLNEYYNVIPSILSTTGLVFFLLLAGYVLIYLIRGSLLKSIISYRETYSTVWLISGVPALLVMLLFALWFEESITAQFIFGFIAFLYLMIRKLFGLVFNVKTEYIIVAENLRPEKIYKEVYWKCLLPDFFSYLKENHSYFWSLILVYEFISNSFGIGSLFRLILAYKDLGAFAALAIIITLLICLGRFLIRIGKNRLAGWEQ